MLKSLEIAGFKSFAKKTQLEFRSRITAIVGPNGSGKSNVAESFRFALGEQSIKSMRGKRGEDLIWNGSNEVPRSNRALVKITLDNSKQTFNQKDGILKNDFEEVIIERVISRDGVNEYLLNGSRVRLKDILELLSSAHIGSSNHHIISQGEADHILSASSKERKTIIEDALGLKIYQYKREESEQKLDKTEENIKQVELLRKEIAPHLKFLKKQVEKAEKVEELKLKLSDFYREYLKREQIYLEESKIKLKTEKELVTSQINALEKRIETAKKILEQTKQEDEKSREIINIEKQIKEKREEHYLLSRELGKVEGEMNALGREIEKNKIKQSQNEDKMIPLSEIEKLADEISVLNEIRVVIQKIKDFIFHQKNHSDQSKLGEISLTIEKLKEKKIDFEKRINEIEIALQELNREHEKIKNFIEQEKDSNREAEKDLLRIRAEENTLHSKLETILIAEERLKIVENDWHLELKEAAVLLGPAILGFENLFLNKEEVLTEERSEQEKRRREVEKMKIRLEELGSNSSSETIKEYKETAERDEYLEKELLDLTKSKESLQNLITELTEKLDNEFKIGIEKINKIFQEYFVLMFGGGEAELKIEKLKVKKLNDPLVEDEIFNIDKENEKEELGIEINISLPRKRIKSLEMLSGGERALTSIALLFALSSVNPPPFIILDETDAALDEANSKKYGDMIEKLSEVSQLILITHNRETMSRAGIIYGVTMGQDGVSRLLSIAFDEAVVVAK